MPHSVAPLQVCFPVSWPLSLTLVCFVRVKWVLTPNPGFNQLTGWGVLLAWPFAHGPDLAALDMCGIYVAI